MQSLTLLAFFVCTGVCVISAQDVAYPQPTVNNEVSRTGRQYDPAYFAAWQYGRLFFNTRTIVIATSTFTTTSTSVTTCTTSTAALNACVAGGRRRRNAGLYHDDEEDSIYLPAQPEEAPVEKEVEPFRPAREVYVPIILEPGFAAANGITPRFLIAFSTTTVTKTTTTTSTSSLTATCSSTSSFQLCGASGK